jgi:hypothetical protein
MSAALYETLTQLPDLPDAACRDHDPELWTADMVDFSKAKWTSRVRKAKAICNACPERSACLQYALSARLSSGIWGGLTVEERKERSRSRPISRDAKCQRGGHPLQPGCDICITCDDAAAKRRKRDQRYREKRKKQKPRKPRGGRCAQCRITKHRCTHPVGGAA